MTDKPTEERPWVCHHDDPSCKRGGYRCSDSCGPLRPGETDPTRENQENKR